MGKGRDFNEIKEGAEKRGERQRSERSFGFFRNFIRNMNMAEIRYLGRDWTWANNRVGEEFVEERLDRFFPSPDWHYLFPKAAVHHVLKQAFDHSFLVMEDNPSSQ